MEKLLLLAVILTASWINNHFIPLTIYYKKFGLFKKRKKGFVGCNTWGIIMDGILAGLLNITALNFFLEIKPKVIWADVKIAIFLGLLSTILIHVFMAVRKWKIWIMPKPWHWNLAGWWHMVSATLQISFFFYPLSLLYKNPLLLEESLTRWSLSLSLLLLGLFLAAFYFSEKGLRIWKLEISNKPW